MTKRTATLTRVRQMASLGLPGGLFIAAVLPMLRAITRSESAAFFWLTEGGEIANVYAERFPPRLSAIEGEARYEAAGIPRPRAGMPVRASTFEQERGACAWYDEVLRCHGAHYLLHGEPGVAGRAVGRITLFRPDAGLPFGVPEVQVLSSILRYVAHGLVHAPALRAAEAYEDEDVFEEEVVVADRLGRLLLATDRGRFLLLMATGCPLGPRGLPLARRQCQALMDDLCGMDAPAVVTRKTDWGSFTLKPFRLSDDVEPRRARIAIHVRRTQPASLRFVDAMGRLPLSSQQREIALQIARGASNRDIAARLGVSVNTVAYHVKQLFSKLDVHGRGEVIAKIRAANTAGEACGVAFG